MMSYGGVGQYGDVVQESDPAVNLIGTITPQGIVQQLADLKARQFSRQAMFPPNNPAPESTTNKNINMSQKRIVQVFIADPDVKVPVEDSLLAQTDPKMTDLTDQELFYEIDVKTALEAHNRKRVLIVDKQSTQRVGKDVMLEPIKIRDLKMTVVVVATF